MSDQLVEFIRNMERRLAHLERLELHNHRVAFLAYNSQGTADATGDGTAATVVLDTKVFDLSSNFASNTFTAPVDGKYWLKAAAGLVDLSAGHDRGYLMLVTDDANYRGSNLNVWAASNVSHAIGLHCSVLAEMSAGHTAYVRCQVTGGTKTVDINGGLEYTYFCGFLVT